MRITLQKIISFLVLVMGSNLYYSQLTPSENYIYSKIYLESVTVSSTTAKSSETVTYFDGLGRPMQNIMVKAGKTAATDLVTPIIYDDFGRQRLDVLATPAPTLSLGIHSGINENSGSGFYGSRPYAEKILDDSPLNRIQQQIQPGSEWQDYPVNYAYLTNNNNEVLKFSTVTGYGNGIYYTSQLKVDGYYTESTLYKNMISDEDGLVTYEFKNSEGQTVLVRKVLQESNIQVQTLAPIGNNTQNVDTYYVYNEYNQLAFVISPLAANDFRANPNQTINNPKTAANAIIDNLCYQYNFDGRNRLVEKKIPGKGWESMVYDKTDRLIMTQDANLAGQGKWMITKYDIYGRIAYTGFIPGGDRESMQSQAANLAITESRDDTGFLKSGIQIYYTNNLFVGIDTILSVNYYDIYPADTPFPEDNKILNEPILISTHDTLGRSTKTLPLASFVKNIDDDSWTQNYSFYDSKRRPIGSTSINHLGGSTIVNSKLDFAGVVQKTETIHKKISSEIPVHIVEDYTYDHQNRILKHYHEVVGKTDKVILADNEYDDLGRIKNKKIGAVTDAAFNETSPALQTIGYSYNIRSWMTGINLDNSGALDITKLFSYKIKYEDPENARARYNGNIAEIDWIYGAGDINRYVYTYDTLNRLLRADFKSVDITHSYDSNYYNEHLTYDINGNIKTLKRNAQSRTGTLHALQVDNLTYNYENGNKSNRLSTVYDNSQNGTGYPAISVPQAMTYDSNGNAKTIPDKGITGNIVYNYLNLPQQIVQNGKPVNYSYRCDGIRVHKQFLVNGQSIDTDYLDGFVYTTPYTNKMAEVLEGEVAGDMPVAGQREALELTEKTIVGPGPTLPLAEATPNFFPTTEGFYDYDNFRYIYQYKDHLGNVRVNYIKNPDDGSAEVISSNDYYPFGLNFITIGGRTVPQLYNPSVTFENYKYSGKELQETGQYDFGARMYMPDIARWGVVDPLAEKMTRHSPYNYAFNNPLSFIDPDGREAYRPTPKEAAAMAAHVYGDKKDNILIGGWRVSQTKFEGVQLEDESSGFKSQVYERVVDGKVTEYAYATAGTEDLGKDGVADVAQPVGASSQYSLSAKNATALSNQLGDTELTYTGHSLGGGLAALNSNLTRREAITFNAAGVGAATKFLNGKNNSDMSGWFGGFTATFRTEGLINAYIMKTDPLNIAQDKSLLMPDVNGKRHTVWPTSASSVYNGHSMDNMLKEFGINPKKYAK